MVFCKLCIRESFSVTECAVVYARFSLPKSILASHLPMEDGVARHSEPRVPRTCLSKQRCLRTSSRPRRYALAPPPPLGRSPARPPILREIFEATPDWASYKRGMRSPRTPRARASRLDRALTSPPRLNTQAIQAAKGYVHFRGSSLVRPPRPRFTGGSGTKTPRARSAPTARRTRMLRLSLRPRKLSSARFAKHANAPA